MREDTIKRVGLGMEGAGRNEIERSLMLLEKRMERGHEVGVASASDGRARQTPWSHKNRANSDYALIADGHELYRMGLKDLLVQRLGLTRVLEASDFAEALALLKAEPRAEMILFDPNSLGRSGDEIVAQLHENCPTAKLVALVDGGGRDGVVAEFAAGAHGVVPKSLSRAEIASALSLIMEGRMDVSVNMIHSGGNQNPKRLSAEACGLTARQRDVLEELRKGSASKVIARNLGIAEGTVKAHLALIYQKLGVRSRAEAIARLCIESVARGLSQQVLSPSPLAAL